MFCRYHQKFRILGTEIVILQEKTSKMNKLKILVFLFFACLQSISAQELQFEVIINDRQVATSQVGVNNKEIVQTLQKNITDFFNNRKWTNDAFEPNEKIKGRLQINLVQADFASGIFKANAQIQALRPVYNTAYETILFSYVDRNFNFNFLASQPLDLNFNENVYFSNLSSLLGYYAYIILAMDYDSFSKNGGKDYVEKAFIVANTAQGAGAEGWGQGDIRDRFWLVENLQSQQMQGIREALYKYHRKGLDIYQEKRGEARKATMELLQEMNKVAQVRPNSLFINVIFDAKFQEFYNIFKDGSREEKQEAYTLLSRLDPARANFYARLLQ
ncbi:hypothetical protein Rain11_2320 [Raineya orbicola]|jgi:hypothetical protein|uniref:DUF4835 domain-containing protein n=2 Tax=Raineya orbicola TaxID=2016530 RepID=A0A2N3I8H9_9BACT|nr:hypothetical protein Rain11_2320 [Raineya orbicola]